jgi:hypothetical protein
MKLPEPSCPMGYTKKDINNILKPEHVFRFGVTVEHMNCTGRAAKADRKSKLQHYATVCADDPHGWVWTAHAVLQFMEDNNYS